MSTRNHPTIPDASYATKESSRMNRPTANVRLLLLVLGALTSLAVIGVGPAGAAAAAPHIQVNTLIPDHITPGEAMSMWIGVENDGDLPMSGNVTIEVSYPAGVSVLVREPKDSPEINCIESGQVDECTFDATGNPPGSELTYVFLASVDPAAGGILSGQIEVSGGGAADAVTVPFSLDTAPIGPFEFKSLAVSLRDTGGAPTAQAGVHPAALGVDAHLLNHAISLYGFATTGTTIPAAPESMRKVVTHAPAGLVGDPTATAARCSAEQLSRQYKHLVGAQQIPDCPRDSQIGMVLVNDKDILPLYNLIPPAGVPAEFGFSYQGVLVTLRARLRPSDSGVDIVAERTSTSDPISQVEVTMWGVPADSSHDNLRGECTHGLLGANGELCPSSAPRKPFLRLPTSCSGQPLPWSMEMDTYEHPDVFHHKDTTTPALENCGALPFEPKLKLGATTPSAHSPSGLSFEISMPQEGASPEPDRLGEADLRSAKVTLPAGVGLNPAAAEGLAACSDAQLRLGLEGPSECPDASKIGTVEVKTPLLDESVGGSVFIRSQNSKDPESGQMYRLAIELRNDERGVYVKLPGSLKVNPATGQLTTEFDDLPQLPFESMQLHLNSGPHAPLSTPQACGTYNAESQLTSWARPDEPVSFTTPMKVNQNCTAPGFAPGFEAGVQSNTAGEFSPFTLRVTRGAGQPNLSSISATLPEGELAKLAGVPVCGDAAAATGACPASSQIGRTVAAVGEGPAPIYLPQPGKSPTAVYFAGPYKGAPYSVVASVPAQSGPFDLGTVVVRSALQVDPVTTRVTVASDPLPQIFGGIPVSYRDVRVIVDRPEYTVTPTSCEPRAVDGTIGASNGASAAVSARFQAGDCAALGFKPKLSISLRGKTRRAGHPALTAVLQMPQGGANIAATSVALPHSEFLAQAHIDTSCTRVQYAAGGGGGAGCPQGSVYGHARAFSPLLDQPLEGPVYLRSNGGERELPDLVASLGGQIHVDLVGYIDTDKKTDGLRTTFANVPDAPVSKFVLKMPGGKKSLLENSTNICRGKHRATVKFNGQNGRVSDFRPLVRARCGKRAH
jgi:hypothetical protein